MMSRAPGLSRVAQRLAAASSAKAHGACGGCDNCGADASAPKSSAQDSPAPEVRVPVSKIGRRA